MKRCYSLGPDQVESIDKLSAELGIKKSDVLANGLRLMRAAVAAARKGNNIGIVREEYVVGELFGPWSDLDLVTAGD